MTKKRARGLTSDGHVRIQRAVIRRVVGDRLRALLRGDFYVRNQLGPEDYHELVREVRGLSVKPTPSPHATANNDDENNEGSVRTSPPPLPPALTANLERFVQVIAASIMIDASMRGENAGESDTRFIKKRKKMLVSALRGPKLYDFRGEVLRFHKMNSGGGSTNDDDDDYDEEIVESEESNDTEDESDGEGDESDDDGRTTTKTMTMKKNGDPPPKRTTLDRPPSPSQTTLPPTGRHPSRRESSSVEEKGDDNDNDDGGSIRRGRRSVESKGSRSIGGGRGDDHSTASESGSSASSHGSGAEENSTIDGFSTSATSSKHRKMKDKKRDKKSSSSSRKKEKKRLRREKRRRRKKKKAETEEKRRRKAAKKLLVAEKPNGKKRKREFEDDDDLSEDTDADSVSGEEGDEGAVNRDTDSLEGSPERRQRPSKRRSYQLATKKEFESFRSEWLDRIPKEIKSRFREGGFSKWGKEWLPVLELGPFDVEPGPVREMWFDMFRNVSFHVRRVGWELYVLQTRFIKCNLCHR
jgi:hypothetical protein